MLSGQCQAVLLLPFPAGSFLSEEYLYSIYETNNYDWRSEGCLIRAAEQGDERDCAMDAVAECGRYGERPTPDDGGRCMNAEEKRAMLEGYVQAMNAFEVEAMVSLLHPEVEYVCISDGAVTLSSAGIDEFRVLAEREKVFFSSRKQTILEFYEKGDQAILEISYAAVLALDLSDRLKTGDTLWLDGISEIVFRDEKIYRINDIFNSLQTRKGSRK